MASSKRDDYGDIAPFTHNEVNGVVNGSIVQARTIHGGVVSHYVVGDAGPRYVLTSKWPKQRRSLAGLPLSQLLAAHHGVVDFAGRDAELTELRRWLNEQADIPAALLIYGPGGQGKTRLAAQFATECGQAGWHAVAARYSTTDTSSEESQEVQNAESAGLLVIVDYAERWPVEDLLRLAADPAIRGGAPLRFLLVARSSAWWGDVRHEFASLGFRVGQVQLGPLATGVGDRGDLFDRARDRFADVLGVSGALQIARPGSLAKDSYGLVLAVHMAALAAVDAHARGALAPEDPAELSAYLLDRERAYWRRLHQSGKLHIRPTTMARSVFTATLAGPLPYPDAARVLERVGVSSQADTSGAVLDDHAICYPGTDAGTVLEPLYPDRLAEDFLALLIPGHDAQGYVPDAWAATVPAKLLTDDPAPPPPGVVQSALTMLVEAARRWPHLVHGQVGPLLRAHPQLALAAGGAVLATVAELEGLDHDVLEAIEPLLPMGPHVDLDVGAAALSARLTDHRLAAETNPATRATRYALLCDRLRSAGRRVEALAAIEEAVRIRRELAELLPPVFRPDLARSLLSRGACLMELGRWDEALTVTEEAQGLYRTLAAAHPVYRPELAAALDHMSNCLSELGRHDEAMPPIEEAVRLRRSLADSHPQTFRPELARSLLNLAVQLSMVNRAHEAIRASEDAVRINRTLAESQPQTYWPELALALNNFGIHLDRFGQHDRALEVAREAVGIYRKLVEVNPHAFEFDLSRSLLNLGNWLARRGQHEHALAATEEAVRIRRKMTESHPKTFEYELAKSLDSLAVDLSDSGRHAEAATVAAEAVEIHRRLTARNTSGIRPDLGDALERLSRTLSDARRPEEALAAAQEAVTVYRRLAAADPAAFLPRLASALNSLGARLSKLHQRGSALTATQEAVEICRGLPEGDSSLLAMALGNLATLMALARQSAGALSAAQEAVQIFRNLTESGAEDHRPELAGLLSSLGVWLYPFGRFEEAKAAADQAVEIYRSLTEADPQTFQPHLAKALHNLGVWLIGLDQWSDAAEKLGEAVQIRSELADAALPESQMLLTLVSGRLPPPKKSDRRGPP